MAESLADLKQAGIYRLAREGYYEQPHGHYRKEFEEQRREVARALRLNDPVV
jgi:hypothetical protein